MRRIATLAQDLRVLVFQPSLKHQNATLEYIERAHPQPSPAGLATSQKSL